MSNTEQEYIDFVKSYNEKDFTSAAEVVYYVLVMAHHSEVRIHPIEKIHLEDFLRKISEKESRQFPTEDNFWNMIRALSKFLLKNKSSDLRQYMN